IAHSLGCILVATTAKQMFDKSPNHAKVAELTLLDPVSAAHLVIFPVALGAANVIENFWEPGPNGYGQASTFPGVYNEEVDSGADPNQINPLLFNHVLIVSWYLDTITNPNAPSGFNRTTLDD